MYNTCSLPWPLLYKCIRLHCQLQLECDGPDITFYTTEMLSLTAKLGDNVLGGIRPSVCLLSGLLLVGAIKVLSQVSASGPRVWGNSCPPNFGLEAPLGLTSTVGLSYNFVRHMSNMTLCQTFHF